MTINNENVDEHLLRYLDDHYRQFFILIYFVSISAARALDCLNILADDNLIDILSLFPFLIIGY